MKIAQTLRIAADMLDGLDADLYIVVGPGHIDIQVSGRGIPWTTRAALARTVADRVGLEGDGDVQHYDFANAEGGRLHWLGRNRGVNIHVYAPFADAEQADVDDYLAVLAS